MTEEKTCYNCGNKNCNVYYSMVKKDYKRHFEIYEYRNFDCVNHDKWEKLKVEEIRTDNTEALKNALERIAKLEKENAELKAQSEEVKKNMFERFRDGELGELQKTTEGFAEQSEGDFEYFFRAGFFCALHSKEINKSEEQEDETA